jgi:hypothetical protein
MVSSAYSDLCHKDDPEDKSKGRKTRKVSYREMLVSRGEYTKAFSLGSCSCIL